MSSGSDAGRVVTIPSFGFARGSVVRLRSDHPDAPSMNMLVVRGLGETTAVIRVESDEAGTLRLREVPTKDLIQVLP